MGLGLPAALLALLAIGVPLWLHRMRRRAEQQRVLPTIALLARAEAEDRRPTVFHDLPLLLARLLILACLVLALAEPHLWTQDPVVGGDPVALACVLDDSLSMQRTGDGRSLFDTARERATDVISALPEGSEVSLVLAGAQARLALGRSPNRAVADTAVRSLEIGGQRSTDLPRALTLADGQNARSALVRKQVWLLTDCTQSSQVAELAAESSDLWVECISDGASLENASISGLSLTPTPQQPDHLTLDVEVRSSLAEGTLPLEVLDDSGTLIELEARLEDHIGHASIDIERRRLREAKGARVRIIDSDAIDADNVRPLSAALSRGLAVLLVDGAPSMQRMDDELRVLGLALDATAALDGGVSVSRTDFEGLADVALETIDVVVLANAPAPSRPLADRLRRHVEKGGGLWIGVGDHADPYAYRAIFEGLLPGAPRGSAEASPPLTLQLGTGQTLLPHGAAGLERAGTLERWLLESIDDSAEVALRFGDGTPALVSIKRGAGRVALWTTSLDDDWSDLPLSPGFVVLAHDLVHGLSPDRHLQRTPVLAGQPVPLRDAEGATDFDVVLPTGERLRLAAVDGHAQLTRTEQVGRYRVTARNPQAEGRPPGSSFEVIVDPRESDLEGAPLPGDAGQREAASGGQGSRRGKRPLGPWVWLLLGLAGLLEAGLRIFRRGGWRPGRPRQAAGPTPA